MLTIAILAAIAMFIEDILATLMVQAEARNKAHLAGFLDSAAWGASIATTTISVSTLQGHSLMAKVVTVVLVSLANYWGTWLGVIIGKKFVRQSPCSSDTPSSGGQA